MVSVGPLLTWIHAKTAKSENRRNPRSDADNTSENIAMFFKVDFVIEDLDGIEGSHAD